MTHRPKDIVDVERRLEEHRASFLQTHEQHALWLRIEPALAGVRGVPSPFVFLGMRGRALIASAMAVVLMVSVGGTAVASESARPGDFLFPVDRVLEDTRLLLAVSDDSRDGLIDAFTAERITELDEIVSEEQQKSATPGAPLSDDSRKRIEGALSDVAQFLEDTGVDSSSVLSGFATVSGRGGDDEGRFEEERTELDSTESRGRDDERFEYRDDEVRIRTTIKEGEVRTKVEFESNDDADQAHSGRGESKDVSSGDDSDAHTDVDEHRGRDAADDTDDSDHDADSEDDGDSHSGSGSGDDDTVDD